MALKRKYGKLIKKYPSLSNFHIKTTIKDYSFSIDLIKHCNSYMHITFNYDKKKKYLPFWWNLTSIIIEIPLICKSYPPILT